MDMLEPFSRWLERFADRPIQDRDNGADRVALIVDDRDEEVVRRVFSNAVAVLGDSWNHRRVLARGDNDFLASRAFWESIPEAHVLIYQRDTVLFRQVPDAAFAWDMIGAPCGVGWPSETGTLNGGLSLRCRSAMLDVVDHVARAVIPLPDGFDSAREPEDVYFTRGLRERHGRVPPLLVAARFAVESSPFYIAPPVGVHGTDKPYLSLAAAERLVQEATARGLWRQWCQRQKE